MDPTTAAAMLPSPTGFSPDTAFPFAMDSALAFTPHDPTAALAQHMHAQRRRKSSKGSTATAAAAAAVVKRSISSPNVRGLSQTAEMASSLAEKRRNKLGYHRTSVACVHCRRRKIRCLVGKEAPEQCLNCIRLKKDCHFTPVDSAQPAAERRPRTDSRPENGLPGEASASSSSSPTMAAGTSLDPLEQFGSYPPLPMPHAYGAATISPPGSAAPLTGSFEYPDPQSRMDWPTRFYDSPNGPSTPDETPMGAYWAKPETPLTPSYSPFTSAPPHSAFPGSGGFAAYHAAISAAGKPDGYAGVWPPTRSMSYSQLEDLTHHGPDAYSQLYQPELRRNTSDMLPPSLRNSTSSSAPSMPEPALLSTGAASSVSTAGVPAVPTPYHLPGAGPIPPPPPPAAAPLSSAWNTLPNHATKSADFANWYSESSQLAKVQEEEIPPHFVHDPTALYSTVPN